MIFKQLETTKSVLELRKQAIVFSLARRLYEELRRRGANAGAGEEHADWLAIESLSQLRGLVGGRFATVKSYWVAAGFPLRAHRGDRSEQVDFNEEGWQELVLWLDEQGYDCRLSTESESICFALRPREEKE